MRIRSSLIASLLSLIFIAGCAQFSNFALDRDLQYRQSVDDFLNLPEEPRKKWDDSARKFALQLFHFNVEYMAGDQYYEDAVIRESFLPLVKMFLRHPHWGADIEMQGYMIEVMAERHPDVLRDLKKLVDRGQVKLISFHYSDQLVVAFPHHDMEWSFLINQDVFAKYGLKLSETVFLQEDQFGEGIAEFARDKGFTIATTDYYDYFHKDPPTSLIWKYKGLKIVPQKNWNWEGGIAVEWMFKDDGELIATARANPYSQVLGLKPFRFRPESLLEYERKLMEKEKAGYALVSIENYVERLKKLGVKAERMPHVLDSVRGDRSRDLFLWLGKNLTWMEKDLEVRSYNFRTRKLLLAAGLFVERAEEKFGILAEERELLRNAWKHQLRSEVSDSTGTVPFRREVNYSFEQGEIAAQIAEKIIAGLKKKFNWGRVSIDTSTQIISEFEAPNTGDDSTECEPPIPIRASAFHKISCRQVALYMWELTVKIFNWNPFGRVEVSFPRFEEAVIYSPALMENEIVRYELMWFDFEKVYLGLPNGLIGLGNNWYVIKHNEVNHTAAEIHKKKPYVTFVYQSPWRIGTMEWKFTLVKGPESVALRFANEINVRPIVIK